jgi:hypothetical protein
MMMSVEIEKGSNGFWPEPARDGHPDSADGSVNGAPRAGLGGLRLGDLRLGGLRPRPRGLIGRAGAQNRVFADPESRMILW